jgi:transposase-like protein
MGKQPAKSGEDKNRIVLAVLRGEISIAEAARREGTSQVSIARSRHRADDRAGTVARTQVTRTGRRGSSPQV